MHRLDPLERAYAHPTGETWMDFELNDPERTALIIIDMQNYGCRADRAMGKLRAEREKANPYWFPGQDEIVVPNIQRLLAFFRENRMRVAYICVGPLLEDASDLYPRRLRRDRQRVAATGTGHFFHVGSWEHQVIDELKPQPGEITFNKNSTSAFNYTNIDQVLRNMGITTLVTTGMATNACVETTARDAADRGYDCVLVEDGCLAGSQDAHDMTMRNFASLFGRVSSASEVIVELQRALKGAPAAR